MRNATIDAALHAHFSALGRVGGKRGTREDKVRAGKIGAQARWGKHARFKCQNSSVRTKPEKTIDKPSAKTVKSPP